MVLACATVLAPHVALAQRPTPGQKAPARRPPPAVPDPSPAPAPAPAPIIPPLADTLNEGARREYEAAKALYAMGDSKGAFYKFQAAYELYADPRLLWNMATCAKNLHQYAEALGLVRRYQKLGGGLLTETDRGEAASVEVALASLTTTLVLKGTLTGAEVTLDDKPVEHPEEPLLADLGPHRITAKKPGFRDFVLTLSGRPMATIEVPIVLTVISHEGTLVIHAGPKDAIALDGKAVGTGSYRAKLASGGHLVRVTAQGYRPFQQEIVLRDDETRTVPVALDVEPSTGLPPWAWVTGGVVIAATVVAVVVFTRPTAVDKASGVPRGSIDPGIVVTKF